MMKASKSARSTRKPNQPRIKYQGVSLTDILKRLLRDVSAHTGVTLKVPCNDMDEWIIKDGPLLDKELLRMLELYPDFIPGVAPSKDEDDCDTCIARAQLSTSAPEWLWPLFDQLFESTVKGGNLPKYKIDILRSIRQILVFGYKSEQQPTPKQLNEAIEAFIATDAELDIWCDYFKSSQCTRLLFEEARKIVSSVTARCDFKNVVGRHGPGSVYPARMPCDKSAFYTYYDPIREYYGYSEHFVALPSFWEEVMMRKDAEFSVEDRIIAKLQAVPKDSRGPRLICVHPKESVWIQLGQSEVLMHAISRHPLTRGRVNFTDQTVNAKLALSSSHNRAFCTMDLKEASDRVTVDLVDALFGRYTSKILSCSRASHVRVPDGRLIELKKWAPMGNGLTFPVESLVFYSLAVAGIYAKFGKVPDPGVYVYGDDVVCPIAYRDAVVTAFTRAGLIVNSAKTFANGFFRESCGVDAFYGTDITPIRVKKGLKLASIADGVTLCDLAKRLRIKGYHHTAAFLYSKVSDVFGPLPKSNSKEYTALYEYQDVSLDYLLKHETPRSSGWHVSAGFVRKFACVGGFTTWHKDLQLHGVWARSVKGDTMSPQNGEWYHLQDALVDLHRRKSVGTTSYEALETKWSPVFEHSFEYPVPSIGSARSLAYPRPYRTRTYKGFIPHQWW